MPTPIVEPAHIQRSAKPNQTVTQDFVVNIFPDGALIASVSGDGSIIRLRNLIAYKAEKRQFTEEEINELPPFPPSIRQNARKNGYLLYSEFARVESDQALRVWKGLLVKGEVEFVAPPTGWVGFVSEMLVIKGENGWQVEIPLTFIIGALRIDYATPVYAHQGQKVRLPVIVTLPSESPSANISLELNGLHWEIPWQTVSVPAEGSATITLTLQASSEAPLGVVDTSLRVKGFDGPYESNVPFSFIVKPFSKQLEASEYIEAKASVLSEGPLGSRFPMSETQDAGNGGFVRRYSVGNIYWHPQTGAKWVYGEILAKFLGLGGPASFLGFPLTDETGTSDGSGRYNHFQGGSIYFSVASGAHEIHGPIRDHWHALGGEKSYLGYPMWDQKENFSRFQRGTINLLTNGQAQDEADTRIVHTGIIHVDGAAANGWAELTINSSGQWHYKGSIRSTGALSYDVAIATAFNFKDSTGRAIAFTEDGDVEGTLVWGGNRAHVWDKSGKDPFIAANFEALRSTGVTTVLKVDFGPGDVLATVASIVGVMLAFIGTALGGASIDKNRKPCCRLGHEYYDPGTSQWAQEKGCVFIPKDQPCPPDYPLG